MSDFVKEVNDSSFETEVLNSETPVLVAAPTLGRVGEATVRRPGG